MTVYRLTYTEEAAATRDALPPERRRLFERAAAVLARDPYNTLGTAALSSQEERKAYLAPGLMVEYYVRRSVLVIIVFEVFDESGYLTDEGA